MDNSRSPELEQEYLQFNGSISIYAAVIIFAATIQSGFDEFFFQLSFASVVFYGLLIIVVVGLVKNLLHSNKFNSLMLSKNTWLGKYEDEFLNQVSLAGYRVSFLCSLVILSLGYLSAFDRLGLSISEVCSILIAINFAANGTTVLIQMRDQDE